MYEVLNVSPAAEPVVIEAAYRALMKRHHPDHATSPDEAATASAINDAYAVLRNPERRADYDRRTEAERRDRALQQHARLTALGGALPPRRRANLFGWSGWLVAAVACGVLASMPRPGPNPSARSQTAETTPSAPTAKGSQPVTITDEESMTELDLLAAATVPIVPAGSLTSAALPSLTAKPEAPQARPKPAARPRVARPARPKSTARSSRASEPDFLEREGYIY